MPHSPEIASPSPLAPPRPAAARRPGPRAMGRLVNSLQTTAVEESCELLDSLLAPQARIDPKFMYDELGSTLFNAICELDEYYVTRAENAIFQVHQASIVPMLSQHCQWVDLGCGDGSKAEGWLRALSARRYVGVDFSEAPLRHALERIARDFPQVEAVGVVADLSRPPELQSLLAERADLPPVIFYPGSSIGNFHSAQVVDLLGALRQCCGDSGHLIIGVDRPKDPQRLHSAYDDRLGVTAAFNLNVLKVVNRRLSADFDPRLFEHQAVFNEAESRIEMYLVCRTPHQVRFCTPRFARRAFAKGERILTELSYKYDPAVFAGLLRQAGFNHPAVYSDRDADYSVYVTRPRQSTVMETRAPASAESVRHAPAPSASPVGSARIGSLLQRFRETRRASEALLDGLSAEDCLLQSMPDASPLKWHLAHTSWFFEQFVLREACPAYHPVDARYARLFNSYYLAAGERHPRPQRGFISRPELEEVLAYRRIVDQRLCERLTGDAIADACLEVVELGIHHECQHQELMLTDLKHHFWSSPLRPPYRSGARDVRPGSGPSPAWLLVPGGIAQVGHGGTSFAFDNESPRHRVCLEPFQLRSVPVTNGEYAAFIADGGYDRPELWLSDGWDLRCSEGWRGPLYWLNPDEPLPSQHCFSLDGENLLEPDEPVCHVSYYEADAYARWAGARLPTEFEWEVAAAPYWDAHHAEANFMESGLLRPLPAGPGEPEQLRQLFGDVWEWTQSAYLSYPGYAPPPGALGEYNGKFMINQMVLRGGSCASPRGHLRSTYRNFFPPHARWQFSGIRLARSID